MLSFLKTIGLLEISLFQVVFYSALWFIDDYFALLITVILSSILFCILLISLITELVERSKVPRSYFVWMSVSTLIPVIVGIFFASVLGIREF